MYKRLFSSLLFEIFFECKNDKKVFYKIIFFEKGWIKFSDKNLFFTITMVIKSCNTFSFNFINCWNKFATNFLQTISRKKISSNLTDCYSINFRVLLLFKFSESCLNMHKVEVETIAHNFDIKYSSHKPNLLWCI